jgi:hypothetical protein
MRRRSTVNADRLCVSKLAILHAVGSALVSARSGPRPLFGPESVRRQTEQRVLADFLQALGSKRADSDDRLLSQGELAAPQAPAAHSPFPLKEPPQICPELVGRLHASKHSGSGLTGQRALALLPRERL